MESTRQPDEISDIESSQPVTDSIQNSEGLSRRDFLKLAGLSLAVAAGADRLSGQVGGGNTYKYEDVDLSSLNLVENPDYLLGPGGEEFREKLTNELTRGYGEIYSRFREIGVKKENYDLGEFDETKAKETIDWFTGVLKKRAEILQTSRKKGFSNVQGVAYDSYYEMASFADMNATLIDHCRKIGVEKFGERLYEGLYDPERISRIREDDLTNLIGRRNNTALWNYGWSKLVEGSDEIKMIYTNYISNSASSFLFTPSQPIDSELEYARDVVLSYERQFLPLLGQRPERVRTVNISKDLAALLEKEMRSLGIDRTITSLSIEKDSGFSGVTYTVPSGETQVSLLHPDADSYGVEDFRNVQEQFITILVHEAYHSLSSRRGLLPPDQKVQLRELELQVHQLANPLRNIKTSLNPNGQRLSYSIANEASSTTYYVEHLTITSHYANQNLKKFADEMFRVTEALNGHSSLKNLKMRDDEKSIDDVIARIRREVSGYDKVTQIFAQSILENAEHILSRKFIERSGSRMEIPYYSDVVLPIIAGNILVYKKEDLLGLVSNNVYMQNYIETLHKRVRNFAFGSVGQELMGDLFSASLLSDKHSGVEQEEYMKEVKPLFKQILNLYKKNGLANLNENPSRNLS